MPIQVLIAKLAVNLIIILIFYILKLEESLFDPDFFATDGTPFIFLSTNIQGTDHIKAVLPSRSRWSRNYLRPGAGAEIISIINIS